LNSAYVHPYVDNHAVSSTYFTYKGVSCKLEDDGYGIIRIAAIAMEGTEHAFLEQIGTVDYTTGVITLSSGLNVSSYEGDAIRVRVVADSQNIAAIQNNILRIKDSDIYVTATGERA
jgi:hypothetical protein